MKQSILFSTDILNIFKQVKKIFWILWRVWSWLRM